MLLFLTSWNLLSPCHLHQALPGLEHLPGFARSYEGGLHPFSAIAARLAFAGAKCEVLLLNTR